MNRYKKLNKNKYVRRKRTIRKKLKFLIITIIKAKTRVFSLIFGKQTWHSLKRGGRP